MRRFRELEARALQPENLDTWCNNGLFALIPRSMDEAAFLSEPKTPFGPAPSVPSTNPWLL